MNKIHNEAISLLWDKKPEEALPLLEKLADSADTLNDRAVSLYALGEKEKALQWLDKALEFDSNHGAAMLNSKYMRISKPVEPTRYKVITDWGSPPKPTPSISVIMPTYNRADFIEEAIRSILAQTRTDFEIMVVNDGGSRECEDIIKRIGSDKIHYIYIEHGGLSMALNAGIAHSRAKYITYLDDDDVFYPDHLKILAGYLDEHPEAKISYTHSMRATQVLENGAWKAVARDVVNYEPFNWEKLLRSNRFAVLDIMHHREAFDEVGGYNENLSSAMDWELWIRLSGRYQFHRIDRVTAEYRKWPGKTQMTAGMMQRRRSDNIVIFIHRLFPLTSYMPGNPSYKKALDIFGKMSRRYPQMLDIIDLRYFTDRPHKMYPLFYGMGKSLIGEGYREAAAASFRAAIAMSPLEPKLYFAWAKAKLGGSAS